MNAGPFAGREHDGLLTTWCTCGAAFHATADTSALVQLLEHQREEGCA